MPLLGVYLVKPSASDFAQASLMCCGVSKSGSPAPNPMISLPSALSCLAFAEMASVNEGESDDARSDMRYSINQPIRISIPGLRFKRYFWTKGEMPREASEKRQTAFLKS